MPTNLLFNKYSIVTVQINFVHPSDFIQEKFSNHTIVHKIDNYKVVRLEGIFSQKAELSDVLNHVLFLDMKMHCMVRYAKVAEEGPAYIIFGNRGNDMESGEGS